MATKRYKSVWREVSPEERARHKALAERIDREEMEEIKAMGRAAKARGDELRRVFGELRDERHRRGWSLAEVSRRSGIDRARLSKLENAAFPNVTFETLTRYASAIEKTVRIHLEDCPI